MTKSKPKTAPKPPSAPAPWRRPVFYGLPVHACLAAPGFDRGNYARFVEVHLDGPPADGFVAYLTPIQARALRRELLTALNEHEQRLRDDIRHEALYTSLTDGMPPR